MFRCVCLLLIYSHHIYVTYIYVYKSYLRCVSSITHPQNKLSNLCTTRQHRKNVGNISKDFFFCRLSQNYFIDVSFKRIYFAFFIEHITPSIHAVNNCLRLCFFFRRIMNGRHFLFFENDCPSTVEIL